MVDLPVLFLINKSDQDGYLGQDSVKEHLQLNSLNTKNKVEVMQMTTKKWETVEAAANWLYENINSQAL